MGKITVFNHVSLDGYYAGPNGEIDWFKDIKKDKKFEKYTRQQSQSGNTLLFGHTTYEMMKSYWPTSDARKNDPEMAEVMNNSPKIVFSKTMDAEKEEPHWKNVRVFREINKNEITEMKQQGNTDFTLLGSGTIVQQFANLDLIDQYALVEVPVILGEGKPLFRDVKKMNLQLVDAKAFKNGIAFLIYEAGK